MNELEIIVAFNDLLKKKEDRGTLKLSIKQIFLKNNFLFF
jgi:hypothetical protein